MKRLKNLENLNASIHFEDWWIVLRTLALTFSCVLVSASVNVLHILVFLRIFGIRYFSNTAFSPWSSSSTNDKCFPYVQTVLLTNCCENCWTEEKCFVLCVCVCVWVWVLVTKFNSRYLFIFLSKYYLRRAVDLSFDKFRHEACGPPVESGKMKQWIEKKQILSYNDVSINKAIKVVLLLLLRLIDWLNSLGIEFIQTKEPYDKWIKIACL